MWEGERAGKETSLAAERALAGTQGKKESLCPLEEGEAAQGGCKDVVRLCGENMSSAKAQLELTPASAIEDSKKSLYKYISNKRRANENLHPGLDAGGNVVTKGEENGP